MENKANIFFIAVGILGICLFIIGNLQPATPDNYRMGRGGIYGILAILMGLYGLLNKPKTGIIEAKAFNFIKTYSGENCIKCKYCDMESYEEYEAHCNFFKIKIDKNHICDLGKSKPQKKVISKEKHYIDSRKRIV